MRIRNATAVIGLGTIVGLTAACAGGGSKPTGGSDLNNPGTWAYEGCKQAVLARVKRDHPQAQAIQFDGHMSEIKETDSRSALTGEGKFPKDGDNFHFRFRCEVNRDTKTVGDAKYDKI
jgi:hypothetical protein